ncbi:DUF4489 domain-containing protein [Clostridium sp. Sa3CUN1]|uniref:DUF4489 domain-containing protein n=1 Tax=Clostridium gallinarum TaxID=2762246 RepID=A0ABR8Q3J2_9CLOT|nr:DUF4489 domain-containing protein [Clostridium gallinarum]MBD7914978.1 DUF4489 domain-containing protein [Clostridium gallinarum]
MIDFNNIIYIKSGDPRRILINNEIKEYVVAEVNVKLNIERCKHIIVDYSVNVDSNDINFFRPLDFKLYKISKNFIPQPIGSTRNIIIIPQIINIQSFFLCDYEVSEENFKYIAVVENTNSISSGIAILNNSNLRVTIF